MEQGLYAIIYFEPGETPGVSLHNTLDEAYRDWVTGVFDLERKPRPSGAQEAWLKANRLYQNRSGDYYLEIVPYVALPKPKKEA